MTNLPTSTYRVQFNREFNFGELKKRLPYLEKLGIGAIYASPVFQATPGSSHGYDLTDPLKINPEIGNLEELRHLATAFRNRGIQWIQDIVPNHMAYNPHNPWINDIFLKGPDSEFYHFFDINWDHPDFDGKVMYPILGNRIEKVLKNNELTLIFKHNRFLIKYFDHEIPVNLNSYLEILSEETGENNKNFDNLRKTIGLWDMKTLSLSELEALGSLYDHDSGIKNIIDGSLKGYNSSSQKMEKLLSRQFYKLTWWRDAEKMINYRRFFTINGLISLRMEDDRVFDTYHQLIFELLREGVFTGLRIDHIDGLLKPEDYLKRIRKIAGKETYIIVEKILSPSEKLPGSWPINGSTGYDFLEKTNRLFVEGKGKKVLNTIYRKFTGKNRNYSSLVPKKKELILKYRMQGELNNLFNLLEEDNSGIELVRNHLKALEQLLIHFPVYRVYPENKAWPKYGEIYISQAAEAAVASKPLLKNEVLEIKKHLLENRKDGNFVERFQQLASALAAKGVEDTSFYIYNRLISLNEVGSDPVEPALTPEKFHEQMHERYEAGLTGLNATSTHDTKRGEDARIRIDLLARFAPEWEEHVLKWQKINIDFKKTVHGKGVPFSNDEYHFYQALIGSLPNISELDPAFIKRITQYMLKVVREGKSVTSWAEPDHAYETALQEFIRKTLDPSNTAFLNDLDNFLSILYDPAVLSAAVQTVLKFTLPGIPDIYNGSEGTNYRFVDPDNRLPVNYERLEKNLDEIMSQDNLPAFDHPEKLKLFLTQRLNVLRKENLTLFSGGKYVPVPTRGEKASQLLAFSRKLKNVEILIVVPLKAPIKIKEESGSKNYWGDTRIDFKFSRKKVYTDIFTNRRITDDGIENILMDFSVSVIISSKNGE